MRKINAAKRLRREREICNNQLEMRKDEDRKDPGSRRTNLLVKLLVIKVLL